MILKIVQHPNDVLRTAGRDLTLEEIKSEEIQILIDDMKETAIAANGVGLAAQQIGKPLNIFLAESPHGWMTFINPRITSRSEAKTIDQEGCLSIQGTVGDVERHKKITLDYLDSHGQPAQLKAENFFARIIQHEFDHINGVLFIDKADNIKHI